MHRLGHRLKTIRQSLNLSQIEVTKRLNISNAVLSNYERNKRQPDMGNLIKLAQVYHVSTDYLLGLTEDPTPRPSANQQTVSSLDNPDLKQWWENLRFREEQELYILKDISQMLEKRSQ